MTALQLALQAVPSEAVDCQGVVPVEQAAQQRPHLVTEGQPLSQPFVAVSLVHVV